MLVVRSHTAIGVVNNMGLYPLDIISILKRCYITGLIVVFFLLSASSGIADSDRIDRLLENLKTHESAELGATLRELRQIGQPALQPLLNALQNEDFIYRRNIVIALQNFKTPEVADVLILVLKDDWHWVVRCRAAYSLGVIKDPRAVEPLIEAMQTDRHWAVRGDTMWALGHIKDPRAVEPLIEVLKTSNQSSDLSGAISSLGFIKSPRAIQALTDAMNDERAGVRADAKRVLDWINNDTLEFGPGSPATIDKP